MKRRARDAFPAVREGPTERLWRFAIERLARRIRLGRLTVAFPDGRVETFVGSGPGPAAEVDLRSMRAARKLLTTGAIGLADAYIAGEIDSPDLASVLELGALHLEPGVRPRVPRGLDRVGRALWRRLSRSGAPRGPLASTTQHYDLGNAFYELWLDPSMTYSSALFDHDGTDLEEAQRAKYRRMCAVADLAPGQRVLEIGSGWGGFAAFAAAEIGCEVTSITVSREQHAYAQKVVAEAGVADLVDVRLEDYRATHGTFDRIVSIEMIESIPPAQRPHYFRALRNRLTNDGRIGLQVITVADHHWESSRDNPDFIRRYVFPGGGVPSPAVLRRDAAGAGLRWEGEERFGASYARTLACWLENFDEAEPEIARLGFDERFRRMWRYYLSYCRAGFATGRADVRQIALARG